MSKIPEQIPTHSILILPEVLLSQLDSNRKASWSKIFKITHSTSIQSDFINSSDAQIFVGNHSDPLLIWPKILQLVFDSQFREKIVTIWHGIEIFEQGSLDQLHTLIRPLVKSFKLNHCSSVEHIVKILKQNASPKHKTATSVQIHIDASSLTMRFHFSENNHVTQKISAELACCPSAQYSSELLLSQDIKTLIRIDFNKSSDGIIQLKDKPKDQESGRSATTKEAS